MKRMLAPQTPQSRSGADNQPGGVGQATGIRLAVCRRWAMERLADRVQPNSRISARRRLCGTLDSSTRRARGQARGAILLPRDR